MKVCVFSKKNQGLCSLDYLGLTIIHRFNVSYIINNKNMRHGFGMFLICTILCIYYYMLRDRKLGKAERLSTTSKYEVYKTMCFTKYLSA
jgi:hypothetical protein